MTDAANFPAPPGAPEPEPERPIGFSLLADLVGQTVEVTDVDDVDGIPVLIVNDRRYLATGNYAAACATTLQAHLATTGAESYVCRVVNVGDNEIGLANPE